MRACRLLFLIRIPKLTARYRDMARNTAAQLSRRPRNLDLNLPQINILNS